jgi:hypothetical protein
MTLNAVSSKPLAQDYGNAAPPISAPKPGATPEGVKKADGGFSSLVKELNLATTPGRPGEVRDVVYIGVGASTAYSLAVRNQETQANLPAGDDTPYAGKMTIIGKSDAWEASVRGGGDINHQHELIDHWGAHAPGFDPKVATRESFAQQNAGQILQALNMGAEAIANSVKNVQRETDGTFTLTLSDDSTLRAKKVVVASGAGAHTAVDHASFHKTEKEWTKAEKDLLANNHINLPEGLRDKAMDLDSFMRKTDWASASDWEGKTIVVHGPNAGIDAVERAGRLGANVVWLSRTSDPVLLDGNTLTHAQRFAEKGVIKAESVSITGSDDGRLKFKIDTYLTDGDNKVINDAKKKPIPSGETVIRTADLYVYALGQDANSVDRQTGEVAVGGFLKDLIDKLEPQYDINQNFSDKPFETVLGFQVKNQGPAGQAFPADTGLEVIGAAASTIANKVKHNFLEKSLDDLGSTAKKDLSGDQAGRLLDALKSNNAEAARAVLKEARDALGPVEFGPMTHEMTVQNNVLRHLEKSVERYFDADNFFNPKKPKDGEAQPAKVYANKELDNTNRDQVSSVLQAAQLGAVKASLGALEAFIPGYVQAGEANFSTDNRTQLRVFIAVNFPEITNDQATSFINDVITMRHRGSKDAQAARATDLLSQAARAHAEQPLSESGLADLLSHGGVDPAQAPVLARTLLAIDGALVDPSPPRAPGASGRDPKLSDAQSKAVDLLSGAWASSRIVVPALGTPEQVRAAYVAELQRLNSDATATATPAVRAWMQV